MRLTIAKELIKAHRGKLNIESKEGKGTKICFTLPIWEKK